MYGKYVKKSMLASSGSANSKDETVIQLKEEGEIVESDFTNVCTSLQILLT